MGNIIHDSYHLPKMLTNFLDQHPEPYCIKKTDSTYIYANISLAKLIGVRAPSAFLHKNEFEFNSRLTENEDTVREWQYQDQLVCESKKILSVLEIHPDAVIHPYIVVKIPFYDNANKCVGILTHGNTLKNFMPNEFVNTRSPRSLLLNKLDDFFTEKESEVVFLMLQGKTCKNIADALSLSSHAVEVIFQKLYAKVGVSHRDDFAEFCYQRNYNRYLPKRFMENRTILFKCSPFVSV